MATEKKVDDTPSLPKDPEVLAARIEQTRDDLAHTLDEIVGKVSPKQVAERTKKRVADTAKAKADDAKAKAATAREVMSEKAAVAKDAVLDAKDAAADKFAELTSHDEPATSVAGEITSVKAGGVPTDSQLTTDQQPLRPTTSDPYPAAQPGVPKEALAAGGAGLLVVLLLVLRRRRRKHRR